MDHRFFCLRGFMKSGTNWVGSLLSSHVEISCVGEFHWHPVAKAFNQHLEQQPIYEGCPELRETAREAFESMIRTTLISHAEPTATVIGERTPHTIVPVILRGVPHICVVRDGRDVLISRVFHIYNHPEVAPIFDRNSKMAETLETFRKDPWFFHKHPEQLLCHQELVHYSALWWKEHIENDLRTMEQFPNLPVHFVRYEDLHTDTAGERKKMFEFLGVDPSRAAKIEGVLKPGFGEERPDEFLRKGAIGDWRNYMTDESKVWFKEIAAQTLIDQGYADSDDW